MKSLRYKKTKFSFTFGIKGVKHKDFIFFLVSQQAFSNPCTAAKEIASDTFIVCDMSTHLT